MPTDTPAANGYVFKQLKRLGLSDALALQTAPMVKVQAFDAGKRLWTKGNEIKHWMFIIQGLVSASVPTTNSESTPISVYGRGAWFGEQSIINRKPSFADYVCLTATEVLTLPAAQFDQLFVTEPNFARFVAKLMAWRVQKTSETLTLMKLGNPCMRVVMGLAQFAEALAYRSDRPPTIGFGEGVEIPIPQNTLASLCGVSRTLFSEYVQQLAQHGWLKLSYGKLEILSIHTWHAFARSQREDSVNKLNASIQELLELLRTLDAA
ncbi:Crp/Fnr family transcriptional regulator [Rhodoferax mekongensis]|uniref:Crp/Fnr family transcriptional regulator n=1 Tax=Rhodoferax mekongensis TaxID=3068341 RepID=A0ABZ0AZB4_9BURK|nr:MULTISPECIES: Crp/Fnr family transcriptional regulator [unclassified Rhodoferax]MDT7514189.1 Crp/Fnr family transcriptional regulator [Rhodoferax sp. TBRC 17199]WNO04986.1 Crp/Fnr family transcriptional regulator [Rhodoferax sp. TBRC 17307]